MGLLFAFDSLYLTRSGDSALYRLRDTNGDDQFDEITKLKDLHGAGDHGPHALRLSPDGKQIYLLAGNFTELPIEVKADPPQRMGGVRTGQRHASVTAPFKAASRPIGTKICCCPVNGMPAALPWACWRRAAGLPPPIPTARTGNC